MVGVVHKQRFISSQENEDAYELVWAIASSGGDGRCVLITGPCWSGKSTLVRECAESIERIGKELAFICTGSDIALAISVDADDSFFERLGAAPILFIDSFDLLLKSDYGQQTAVLLLEEREKQGLSTILVSHDLSFEAIGSLGKVLEPYARIDLKPLDANGRQQYVRSLQESYQGEGSPRMDDGAVFCLANEMGYSYRDMDNAVHFLMTASGLHADDVVDAAIAQELLKAE